MVLALLELEDEPDELELEDDELLDELLFEPVLELLELPDLVPLEDELLDDLPELEPVAVPEPVPVVAEVLGVALALVDGAALDAPASVVVVAAPPPLAVKPTAAVEFMPTT